MNKIQNIFITDSGKYLAKFGNAMPTNHKKVIGAIVKCRTGELGTTVYHCEDCNEHIKIGRSCGNRFCPVCQYTKTNEWLKKRLDESLPGNHFMLTFTIPEELRRTFRSNQRVAYSALFKASSDTIKAFVKDKKVSGGDKAAFWGILHTSGRTLNYHPHIHYVVAGGSLSKDKRKWLPTGDLYFANGKAMGKVFKGKLKEILSEEISDIPKSAWMKDLHVNSQAVGGSERSTKYLSAYVFKAGISDSRIISHKNGNVTFWYKKQNSNRRRTMTLPSEEFIRRYLQNVLPKGFMKIRYYGCIHPASKIPREELLCLIELAYGFEIERREVKDEGKDEDKKISPSCKHCGGKLTYLYSNLHKSEKLIKESEVTSINSE